MTKLKRKSAIILTAFALFAAALLAFPGAKLWNTEWGGNASAADITPSEPTKNGNVYQIGTAGELYWFADKVTNENGTYHVANAVLTKDIVVNEKVLENGELVSNTDSLTSWTPISRYLGTFDGQGYTISGLYCVGDKAGFFNSLENGARIKNLGIIDSYFESKSSAGALCVSSDSCVIINCFSTGVVKSSPTDSTIYYSAGISAQHTDISKTNESRILNCWSTANVSGGFSGGICGYNSYNVFNCYSTQNPIANGNSGASRNVETKNEDAFKSGEVAYLLSQNAEFLKDYDVQDYTWGQYLSNNDYPVLKSFPVYKSCNGTSYTNNLEESVHKFTESFKDGSKKCTTCGTVEKTTIDPVDGVYQIGTVGELYWFADKVNNGNVNFQYADAFLNNDIIINEDVIVNGNLNSDKTSGFVSWTPISQNYHGTFDGKGHTISGLYCVSNDNAGLFTNLQSGACIQNIGIIDSYFKGNSYVGTFCGTSNYGTIKNCYSTGIVYSTNTSSGCVGGISAANLLNGRIINCWSNAKVEGGYKYTSGSICGHNNATLTNCYGTDTDLEKFKSGEVAYFLSKGEDGSIWRQTIGTDDYPVLDSSHKKVLANEDETRFANNTIISGVSLTITDNFIISAYVKVSDDADPTYELDNFGLNYKIENINTEIPSNSIHATRDGDVYRFTMSDLSHRKIAAKEMDTIITLNIKTNGGTVLDETTFTVNEYLDKLADTKPEYADLVKAAQNYGEAAKQYFTDGGTVADTNGVTAVDFENYGMILSNNKLPSNVKYIGSTLLLNSEITLRHYFKVSTNNVEFTVDGEPASITTLTDANLSDIKCIDIRNNINQLQSPHEMECNGKTFITNSSVLSYAKSVLEDENADENLKNLVKAIYVYNQEALKFS